jgi:lysophospholipase L1-like esterase
MTFNRFVALGDSTTEGMDDPYPDGRYRGWADRLAEHIAQVNPQLRYANLAVRGRGVAQIRAEQLAPALALEPDLATVVGGLNDALRPSFDIDVVAEHLDAMIGAFTQVGATVATFTLPDPVPVTPIYRLARGRIFSLNAALREIARRHGAVLLDLELFPVAADPRLRSVDRLHGNPEGHRRIAAALAYQLGVSDSDDAWTAPLGITARLALHRVLVRELAWSGRYLLPWIMRRVRGRSSGDGVTCKRPQLDFVG